MNSDTAQQEICNQRRADYIDKLMAYSANQNSASGRNGSDIIRDSAFRTREAIIRKASEMNIRTDEFDKCRFRQLLDTDYHTNDEMSSIINMLFTETVAPGWLYGLQNIIIDGGTSDSRMYALDRILFRLIICNRKNLNDWNTVTKTWTSVILKLGDQLKFKDKDEESLRDTLIGANVFCLQGISGSSLLRQPVIDVLEDIFEQRRNKLTIFTVDSTKIDDASKYGSYLRPIISTAKFPGNPSSSVWRIRVK